jgi:hypothetical protein
VSYTHFRETVPLSVVEGDADGELIVDFDWRAGSPPSGMSGPPENYDPGESDEFVITAVSYDTAPNIPVGLAPHEEEKVIEWLDENWMRPTDYDRDDIADMRRDEALLEKAERMESSFDESDKRADY